MGMPTASHYKKLIILTYKLKKQCIIIMQTYLAVNATHYSTKLSIDLKYILDIN